jgi:hypothetical protein
LRITALLLAFRTEQDVCDVHDVYDECDEPDEHRARFDNLDATSPMLAISAIDVTSITSTMRAMLAGGGQGDPSSAAEPCGAAQDGQTELSKQAGPRPASSRSGCPSAAVSLAFKVVSSHP